MLATPRYRAGANVGQIVELPDGQFLTMTAEGKPPFQETLGYEAFDDPWTPERLVVRRGRGVPIVWSAPEVVHTMPGSPGLWGVGRGLVDRNGDLHAIGLRFLKWPRDIERPRRDEMRCDVFHVASRDGGTTWEPPHRVDYGREYTGALLGFMQMSSGRLVLPIHFYDFDREAGKNVAKSCYSDDGGRTWYADSTEVPVPSGGRHSHSGAVEPTAVELGDGRVWMVIRTQFRRFYESFSSDGRTWSAAQPTRFRAPNSPCAVERLADGRLIFVWNNTQGPPFGGETRNVHASRHVMNAAVSPDDGVTWHGYREFARQIDHDQVDDQVSYPSITALADGHVLVQFAHVIQGWRRVETDYVVFDPDVLSETTDADDFTHGLRGWSTNGCGGVEVAREDGEAMLRLQRVDERPTAAERNFPFGPRGELRFEIRRAADAIGVDLVMDETFWRPNDRRTDGAVDASLGIAELPAGLWAPVTVAWDVGRGEATVTVNGSERRMPIQGEPCGLCYLTLYGRATGPELAGTDVRRLAVEVSPE